jgi:hypothetical protein
VTNFANDFETTLSAAVTNEVSATTLTVVSADGSPVVPFTILLMTVAEQNKEYCLVTAKSGTGNRTWTVTRAIEGGSRLAHAAGEIVAHVMTAGTLADFVTDAAVIAHDLDDFPNASGDPFARESDIPDVSDFVTDAAVIAHDLDDFPNASGDPFARESDIPDLTWENLTGDQTTVGLAGFDNTAGDFFVNLHNRVSAATQDIGDTLSSEQGGERIVFRDADSGFITWLLDTASDMNWNADPITLPRVRPVIDPSVIDLTEFGNIDSNPFLRASDPVPAHGHPYTEITDAPWTTFDGDWSSLSGTAPDLSTFPNSSGDPLVNVSGLPDVSGFITTADVTWENLTGTVPDLSTFPNSSGDPLVNVSGLPDVSGFITDINGQDLSLADNRTSAFLSANYAADGTYDVYNDGSTTGQLTSITIAGGLITVVSVLP